MRQTVLALSLALGVSLSAARVEVVRNGAPVADAEVCVSAAAGFFAKSAVTCSPAAKPVELGRGRWNVFARKGTALVSSRVESVTAEEARAKTPRLELVDAATVDAAAWPLADGEQLQLWVPSARSAFAGGLAPAGTVIPLVVMKGNIVRVGAPVTLAAGETRKLDAPPARAGHVDAVVGVAFHSVPEGIGEAPVVAVTDAKGRRHTPALPLGKGDATPGETLLFFREVPAGALIASLSGARWKNVEAKLPPAAANVVALEKPLDARATSKLALHWWTPNDLTKLAATQRTCASKEAAPAAPFTANLLWCGDRARDLNAYISPRDCTSVAKRELAHGEMRGTVTFEDVAAGVHFVELSYPKLPPIRQRIEVSPRESTSVDVELRYFTFFGRITQKGEPVEAELFGTLSDPETGRYDAVLPRSPGAFGIRIRRCDGTLDTMLVPEEAPVENAAFDVELPHNRIIVDVVDAKQGTPVADAQIMFAALQDDPANPDAAWFAGAKGKTDAQGRFVIEPVLENKNVKVCAASADHEHLCAEPFKMADTPEKQIRMALVPVVKRYGRLVTGAPIEYAQLVWFSPAGQMTEMVREVEPDGRFTYKKPHAEGDILAVIAEKQPLFATLHPRLHEGDELVVRVPPAPRRTFTVTLSEDTDEEGAFVALRIGDVVVPINALSWHLARRGLQPSLMPGASMTVADVLATGPIRVILIPFSMARRYMNPRVELPLVPEIGTFPQQDLGDRAGVVFGVQSPRAKAPQALTSR